MARYSGIGHRFWVMFSLLVAAISVVTALGVYAATSSIRQAVARQELEQKTGRKVVSGDNYLPPSKSKPSLKS